MRYPFLLMLALAIAAIPADARAQRNPKKDEEFVKARPAVGDPLPEVTVSTPDGKPFETARLRGGYTVLTFGCLT